MEDVTFVYFDSRVGGMLGNGDGVLVERIVIFWLCLRGGGGGAVWTRRGKRGNVREEEEENEKEEERLFQVVDVGEEERRK